MPMISKTTILEKALAAVKDREAEYDDPIQNFTRTARLWEAHLRNRYGRIEAYHIPILDAVDVALMLDLVKTARLEFDPGHLDSWVDKAGYSACGARCAVRMEDSVDEPTEPEQPSTKWFGGIEYRWEDWHDGVTGWFATGRHDPTLTNTPHRGEPLGSRDR